MRDERGAAVAGAMITEGQEDPWAVSRPDGGFRLGPLSSGEHEVTVLPDGLAAGAGRVSRTLVLSEAETQRFDIDLDGAILEGVVRDPDGAVGVAVAQGEGEGSGSAELSEQVWGQFIQVENGEGRFQIEGLPGGPMTVRAISLPPGPDGYAITQVRLGAGERRTVTLEMRPPPTAEATPP